MAEEESMNILEAQGSTVLLLSCRGALFQNVFPVSHTGPISDKVSSSGPGCSSAPPRAPGAREARKKKEKEKMFSMLPSAALGSHAGAMVRAQSAFVYAALDFSIHHFFPKSKTDCNNCIICDTARGYTCNIGNIRNTLVIFVTSGNLRNFW